MVISSPEMRRLIKEEIRRELTSGDITVAELMNTILEAIRDDQARTDIESAAGIFSKRMDIRYDNVGLTKETTLAATRDKFPNAVASLVDAPLPTAQSITVDMDGRTILSVYAKATAATTFTLEGSDTSTFDVVLSSKEWSAVTSVTDLLETGVQHWRIKSAAAGAAGDKVTLKLSGGR